MKYVIAIAEYHSESNGELYNSIIVADSEKDGIEKFKKFLEQEKQEGHECRIDIPNSLDGIASLDFSDIYGDRMYRTNGIIVK